MKQKSILTLPLILLAALLFAACGPADPQPAQEDTVESESETTTAVTGSDDQEQEETNSETAAPAATKPPVTVETDSTETDATGIEVGFTKEGRPYRGDPDAPVVIEEFSDYQCPFCARFKQQTMPSLEENQIANGEAMIIFYDFPLTSIHPQAMAAANAARCAGEQGAAAYWAMHDLLFSSDEWGVSDPIPVFTTYGQDLGLEMEPFSACLENEKYFSDIEADVDLGVSRGVRSTPSFFINDQLLVGAQPLSSFVAAIDTVSGGGEIAAAEPTAPSRPAVAPTPAAIPLDTAAATLGDADAPVTIVEYTDYQCPYCSRHVSQTMPTLIGELVDTGRVYYVIKDFPLDQIHPDARAAAAAARCAGEQDAYWEMHDALFAEQEEWSGLGAAANEYFVDLAGSLQMDADAFTACVESGRYDDAVQANFEEGAALGVTGTPAFFINGYPVVGAQPYDLFAYAVELAEEGTLADAYVQQQEEAPEPEEPERPQGPVDVSTEDAYAIGDPDAPVTIVEFTDFQCPFCSRHFAQTFPKIKGNYIDTGVVRYVFKDFPLTTIHPQATLAAEAARCAGDQEAYLEMHHQLFSQQSEWANRNDAMEIFIGYAENLGLDGDTFTDCLETHKHLEAVEADLAEGSELGVNGTPAFFINGYFVSGAQPYQLFEQAIRQLAEEESE